MSCAACLSDHPSEWAYDEACLTALFERPALPRLDMTEQQVYEAGESATLLGHSSISGVQPKALLRRSADRQRLESAVSGTREFILKPQSPSFRALPENEHVTMCLAKAAGITVPPFALVRLADETIAYLIRVFDRTFEEPPRKLAAEDFCQLAGLPSADKYKGSAELCARLVKQHAHEAGAQLVELFRRFVVGWAVGNGDMHLKNFTMLTSIDGHPALSPAYDMVCTRLLIPDDRLALPVGGKPEHLTRRSWREFGAYCGLAPEQATEVIGELAARLGEALPLVDRSYLPGELKDGLKRLLEERVGVLSS